MKRARSALSLRNMATSIHRSIQQHATKTLLTRLPSARSQARLPLVQPPAGGGKLSGQQRDNRMFILEKQIAALERELDCSKNTIRTYSKELGEYEQVAAGVRALEEQMEVERTAAQGLRNQILMLREEVGSVRFNAEQRVAEKEYYEELIQTYCRQYQVQSGEVVKMLELEETGCLLEREVIELEERVKAAAEGVKRWREETDFDLNEHKLKNSLKIARMELIQYQDICDTHCNQHGLRKLRELCCLFFKTNARKNGVGLESAEGGIDMFLCKEGLVQEFGEFIRQRLIYNKPPCKTFELYIAGLTKIQTIFKRSGYEANRRLHAVQVEEVKRLEVIVTEKKEMIDNNQVAIKAATERIEAMFGEESLAVIEYLRERNKNRYDIREIKAKLKENKKEQDIRIARVREAYAQVRHLQKLIAKDGVTSVESKNQALADSLTNELQNCGERVEMLKQRMNRLNQDKDTIETLISNAISKWRERDQNKARLKHLYQQLAQTKQSQGFILTKNLSQSQTFKDAKKANDYPLAESIRSKVSRKDSVCSNNQSRSILSLNNPYKKIMEREVGQYQPIIEDCQMILSRKLNSRESPKPFSITDLQDIGPLKQHTANIHMKKTKVVGSGKQRQNKQNQLGFCRNKSQLLTQTKNSLNIKPSIAPSATTKGKLSDSQRCSLSKLLISRFNR